MADDFRAAVKQEVLSTRALTYRRNAIALSVVLVLIYYIPSISYDDMSFFGIRPRAGASQKTLLLTALWVLLIYHIGHFAYYARRDYRLWAADITRADDTNRYFPEMWMYFGRPPSGDEVNANAFGRNVAPSGWERKDGQGKVRWHPKRPKGVPETNHGTVFVLAKQDVKHVRERLLSFTVIDCGFVALTFLSAVTMAGVYGR
jgi:hypothetical protein